MVNYLNIALIIISVLLILSVILQSKGAGLGGLSGADTGSVYTARRGVERTLFRLTIILSVIFFCAGAHACLCRKIIDETRPKGAFVLCGAVRLDKRAFL